MNKIYDDLEESEATFKRLFTPIAVKRALAIKTISKEKMVFRYPLEKLFGIGDVVIETNFNMKTREHKK